MPFAVIGNDAPHAVVWGAGVTTEEARSDARKWIEDYKADTGCIDVGELRTVRIDDARYAEILKGELMAPDLWQNGEASSMGRRKKCSGAMVAMDEFLGALVRARHDAGIRDLSSDDLAPETLELLFPKRDARGEPVPGAATMTFRSEVPVNDELRAGESRRLKDTEERFLRGEVEGDDAERAMELLVDRAAASPDGVFDNCSVRDGSVSIAGRADST